MQPSGLTKLEMEHAWEKSVSGSFSEGGKSMSIFLQSLQHQLPEGCSYKGERAGKAKK